jgi:outer membrane receptor protein involved in Fe transport
LAAGAGSAQAAEQTFVVRVPGEPLKAALLDFAVQTDISLGVERLGQCANRTVSLVGRYSRRGGLDRLLAGSGCGYRQLDRQAFDIVRLAPPQPAPAAAPPAPADLSELVVVATMRATPADRLAYAVSHYSGRNLASEGVRDTSDLALVTPSMTVTNLGSGRDKILLRGLSDGPLTGQAQSMVGLYLDDTRLTYNAPDPDLRLVDIAGVEVLRGPQGALYGAGSLGGVVHIITIRPDAARFSASATATVAATQGGAASEAVDAVINAPLPGHRGAVRLVGYGESQGGYMDDAVLGIKNANASRRRGGRAAVTVALDNRWTLSAGATSQAIDAADTQYSLAGDPAYVRTNRVLEPHDNDFTEYHVSLSGDLSWGQLRWSTSHVRHGLDSRYDATAAPPVPTPNGPAVFDEADRIDSIASQAIVTANDAAAIQWLAGAFVAHTLQTVSSTLTVLTAPSALALQARRRDRLDEGALFGEITAPLNSAVSLTVGGRIFTAPISVSSATQTPLSGGASAFTGGVGAVGFAPKFVLSYAPTPHALIYVQAAEGYRSPGVNTAGPPGQVFSGPGGPEPYRLFQSDELWSVEAGGKFKFLDDRLRLQLIGFEAFWRNIQSDQLLSSGLPFTANLGDGQNSGVEFEGDFRAGALTLSGQFLLNAPELTRANPALASRSDFSLSAVPDLSVGAVAHYAWMLAGGDSFALDGRATYVGQSRLVLSASPAPVMGGYATGRLAATFASRRWRTTLAVDNPADAKGNTFAYGNPFTVRSTRQITPLRRRTVSLAVTMSY